MIPHLGGILDPFEFHFDSAGSGGADLHSTKTENPFKNALRHVDAANVAHADFASLAGDDARLHHHLAGRESEDMTALGEHGIENDEEAYQNRDENDPEDDHWDVVEHGRVTFPQGCLFGSGRALRGGGRLLHRLWFTGLVPADRAQRVDIASLDSALWALGHC